jgi:hypothetical protein
LIHNIQSKFANFTNRPPTPADGRTADRQIANRRAWNASGDER